MEDPCFGALQLSKAVCLSPSQLCRRLKSETGTTPNVFIRKIRLQRALEMLADTALNISEIAWSVGFNDPNYFARAFSREFGKAPSALRN